MFAPADFGILFAATIIAGIWFGVVFAVGRYFDKE